MGSVHEVDQGAPVVHHDQANLVRSVACHQSPGDAPQGGGLAASRIAEHQEMRCGGQIQADHFEPVVVQRKRDLAKQSRSVRRGTRGSGQVLDRHQGRQRPERRRSPACRAPQRATRDLWEADRRVAGEVGVAARAQEWQRDLELVAFRGQAAAGEPLR
jgi:hypothetical protein